MLRTKRYAPERYIPAGVTIPSDLDLSLIRLADMTKALPSDTTALPWSPTERSFQAAFVGINKCIDIDPTIVSEFPPAVTKKKIEACVNDLKPMRLSTAQGHAEFMWDRGRSHLLHGNMRSGPGNRCGSNILRYCDYPRFFWLRHNFCSRESGTIWCVTY
jgi:hypothetical protein